MIDKKKFIVFAYILAFFTLNAHANVPISSDSRIKTLVYSDNEIFRIVVHYGYQTSIEFGRGEEVETLSVGQPYSWKITPLENRLFIKALEGAAHTNMTIITNRRVYFFELESKDPEAMLDEELAYVVRFYYPEKNFQYQQLRQFSSAQLAPKAIQKNTTDSKPNLYQSSPFAPPGKAPAPVASPINFHYTLTGADNIAPVKVFDDGKKTYLQFPHQNAILPYMHVINPDGSEKRASYTREGDYIAINQLFHKLALRLNNDEVIVYNESKQ